MQQSNHLQNPFVGLRSYVFRERLFGRETEASTLHDVLVGKRLVLLHAPSGAGKTSLVEAKLRPMLEESGIGVVIGLRPLPEENKSGRSIGSQMALYGGIRVNTLLPQDKQGNRFVYSVISQIDQTKPDSERLDVDQALTLDLLHYFEDLAKSSASDVDFLHFDQFEEVLRLDERDIAIKKEFFRQLGLALYERRWLAVFSIRDEYVGALEPYLRYLPTQLKTRFRLDRLNGEAAHEAVVKTAKPQREFQPGAAETLIDNLVDKSSGFVEPSILQVVCHNLWDAIKPPQRTYISKDDVKDFDADTALKHFYEDGITTVLKSPEPAATEAQLREWFNEQLIVSRVRNTILRRPDTTAGLPNAAVEQLVSVRLIVSEERRDEMWYELTHDRLVGPILESNREFESDLRIREEKEEAQRQLEQQREVAQRQLEQQRKEAERQRQVILRYMIIAFVIVGILLVGVASLLNSYQTFPLQQGVLAYTSNDSQEIFIMEGGLGGYLKILFPVLGENPHRLRFDQHCYPSDALQASPAAINTSSPAFASDGRVAFTVDRACIFVETAAHSGEYRQLTENGRDPAWSHDGTRIAFTRLSPPQDTNGDGLADCSGLSDIYIMEVNGMGSAINFRDLIRPAELPTNTYRFATFSPDGNAVAFESSPCASSSGDLLSFSVESVSTESVHTSDIWIAQLGADAAARCIVNVTKSITAGTTFSRPVWLEQGRILISGDYGGNFGIYAFDPPEVCAGSSPSLAMTLLSFSPANEYAPTASPDGRIVVFQSDLLGYNSNRAMLLDSRVCPNGDITACGADDLAILNDIRRITELGYWKAS